MVYIRYDWFGARDSRNVLLWLFIPRNKLERFDKVFICFALALFTFLHGAIDFSLIAKGNIERLEVVNKKWVRVVQLPGTETTTVS